ncbi:MAG TPA: U32 family peptidase [Lentimicrobium sp.]|nr:U32 family peptidase [Lentimicrobium sp.]
MPELLSPAKNLNTGKAAIDSGADAVYIGARRFGARSAAGNSVSDIQELVEYAHQFFAKVYVTVNTLLYEDELKEVEVLINQLYEAGVDAVIIQDPAILKMHLPPIALHASTQMHNNTPERVKFLQDAGLQRVVLARELSVQQIVEVREKTTIELEAFIHGSLCVSYSGRCYLSESIGGRSANRGECAQPCRNSYNLTDETGNVIIHNSHLLSLRDLNLSNNIGPLIDAGITSFKIEGRLKDVDYVRNITAYYRQLIDSEIAKRQGLKKTSSGTITAHFTPDPTRSFNRGFTDYFINDRKKTVTNPSSPKSEGKVLGTVLSVIGKKLNLKLCDDFRGTDGKISSITEIIANGDGLCWYDASGKLIGTRVNLVKIDYIMLNDTTGLLPGMVVMRNYDKAFAEMLNRNDSTVRTIDISLSMKETDNGYILEGIDEDGIRSMVSMEIEKIPARTPDTGYMRLRDHLIKAGSTIFNVNDIKIDITSEWFFQSSVINGLRRELMEQALDKRLEYAYKNRVVKKIQTTNLQFFPDPLSGKENIANSLSAEFYSEQGLNVEELRIQEQPGSGGISENGALMTTKMCLKYELGKCPTYQKADPSFPKTAYLSNRDGRFRLSFDCKECVMRLFTEK